MPITRAEIERIRGVDCGGVLKNLMAKNLIIIDGRSPAPGKPILYRTSEYFLEFFGLPSLEHLPPLTEFEEQMAGLPKLTFVKGSENGADGEGDGSTPYDDPDSLEYNEDYDPIGEDRESDEPVEDKVSTDK